MNKGTQGNRLLISFVPLHVCVYPDSTTALVRGKSGSPLFPFAALHSENKYETHGKLQPPGGRGIKTSHPNSSERRHIFRPLCVPSIFRVLGQVLVVLAVALDVWVLVLGRPVSHSCSLLLHPWTRIFHCPKPQFWQRAP